jgi:NAD(P)-dependent dehydrogenase (short-subunit alcohol dehydrogenase family)
MPNASVEPSSITTLLDRLVLPGMATFTNLGFRWRQRRFEPIDADLSDRVVVVTGATSGLGLAAAEAIAGLGATTLLVGRNADKADQARADIVAATGNSSVFVELADMSLVADVRALGERLVAEYPSIHVLVNNAGALFNERSLSAEGIELTLATNLLSGFLLTNMLIPQMKASAPARIVNVSSGGMYTQGISIDNLQWIKGPYSGTKAYARTKRGQVVLTELWAEMLEGTGVVVNAMHPGWAATPGIEASLSGFGKVMGPLLRTPQEGADTIVWLAASEEAAGVTGGFFLDRALHETNVLPNTEVSREKSVALWHSLCGLAGWDGPGPDAGAGR